MDDNVQLVAACLVFKKEGKKLEWFLIRESNESGWEIPRSIGRTGESSVRAGIRAMAEQGGMRVQVHEEVGRKSGAASVNGKVMTQKTLYYLMEFKDGGEVLGYDEYVWLEHKKAITKITAKKDIQMMKDAKVMIKELEKQERINIKEE